MEHSLQISAPNPTKLFFAHVRRAVVVAVALGIVSASTANALADDQAPLTGQVTPALSAIAAPAPIPGRFLVTFSSGVSDAEQEAAISAVGASEVSTIPALRMHVVDASEAVVAALNANQAVASVEADQVRNVQAAPSDPGYSSQWSLSRIGWDQAFGSINPSGSATVAVLDTGVDASHPDLAGQLARGTSIVDPASDGTTDPNGHGTWMAGIVAAATDNGTGIAGIGYAGVKVMPVAVLGADGTGSDGDIINGVVYAADHGANVILMSFTNPAFSHSLQDAIDYAWSKGAVVVAAAGNDESATVNYPAGDRGVVGVANSDQNDSLSPTSNYGQDVFMAAPGTNIYTTSAGGGYATITGTSASAAEVAGAAALIKANSPDASNGVIVGRLGADAEALSGGQQAGNGRLNLARALNDSSTSSIEPAGAAPVGEGGPVVGPYVIAAKNLAITLGGTGTGSVAIADETDSSVNKTCSSSCSAATGNTDKGTLTASPGASSTFAGWSERSTGITPCTEAAGEGTCKFSMGNSAQNVTATFSKLAADGSGSMVVSPASAVAGSGGNTLAFTYTAAAGGLRAGSIQLSVPSGWSAPSVTSATKGYTTASAGTVGVSGQNITVSGLTLAGGATVTITFGDKTGGGAGADAPGAGSSGTSTFNASEKSGSAGTLAALTTSPTVTVTNSANGSGSMAVSPTAAIAASGGNTLSFTYTAVAGGLNKGAVQLTVPSGWSAPSTTSATKGYTTSSTGTVGVSGQTITVSELTLAANATVTITYGDKTGGGAGADAAGAGTSTFNTSEKSTSGETLTALASSPGVHLSSPTVSPNFPTNNAAYNAAGWAAGCATAGLCGAAGDTGSTISGVQVSIKRNSDNAYWSGTSFVAGSETYLAASGTTSWSFALAASALSDGNTYTVHAKSTDSVGNVSSVASTTFTYDTTAPSPTVSTPANNSSINKTTPTLSGAAGTASGDNVTVTVKIYNGTGTGGSVAQTFNNVAVASGSWSVSPSALAQGTYTAQVTQGDSAGNSGSATSTFTVDTTAPVTTDDVPSAYVNHDITVTLGASDTGGSGLDKTYYTTDGSTPTTSSQVYNAASKPVLTSDGQTIKYFSTDKAGNEETAHSATAHIDRAAPTTTDNVPAAYVNHDVTVTLSASDTGGSGVDKTYYTTDGSAPTTASSVYNPASKPVLTTDGQVIKYFSTDKAGNEETAHSATAHIDRAAPTTTDDVPAAYVNHDVTVTLSPTDTGGSGLDKTYYTTDGSAPTTASSVYNPASKPVLSSDGQVIKYFSSDKAGNDETAHSATAHIARSAPTTTDDVPSAFVNHNVTVTLSATDTGGSGVNKTYYTTDGSTPTTASSVYNAGSKPVLTNDGQIIKYLSTDNAGNEETPHSATAHIDRAAPATTDNVPSGYVDQNVTVTLSATDTGGSGVDKTYYTTDGSAPSTASSVYNPASKPVLTSDGQTIKYFSTDKAGNEESVHSATAHIDRSAPMTTDNVPTGQATSSITVTLTASDTGGSGVDKTYYTTDGSAPSTSSPVYNPASKPVLSSDGQMIKYFSTDHAGNSETPHSATAHIQTDGIAPTTTDNVDANWHVSPVSVTLTATDNVGGSGVKATSFKVYSGSTAPATSDSGWQAYNPAAKPMLNNGQAIAYYSTDNAGNQESVKHSSAAKVDAVNGVTAGATYTLGSVPAAVCVDTTATVSYSGKVGSVTATCTDVGGAVGVTYTVAYCATGLTSPVSGSWVTSSGTCTTPAPSTAVYNTAKAGSSVPLKFSLHGNQGLAIFAAGYPLSQQVLATGSFTDNTVTSTAGESGLSYDPSSDQYTYVWKTSKEWSGQNRQLVLELNDGVTYIRANFYLK